MFDSETIRLARRKSGLPATEFAEALGYRHAKRRNLRQQIYDMETGRKPISAVVARLAEMFRRFGVPDDFLANPERPRWQDWQDACEVSQKEARP